MVKAAADCPVKGKLLLPPHQLKTQSVFKTVKGKLLLPPHQLKYQKPYRYTTQSVFKTSEQVRWHYIMYPSYNSKQLSFLFFLFCLR